jgi:hypothetical protein
VGSACAAWVVLAVVLAERPAPESFGRLLPPAIHDRLGLSEEQKEEVARLQAEFREKCLAVRDEAWLATVKIRAAGLRPPDRATKRKLTEVGMQSLKAFGRLSDEYEPKLRALLTDDQRREYDAWKKAAAKK